MKTITLIRHGESAFKSDELDSSLSRNCALTDIGKIQASQLSHNFDVLIVSPLKRALQTYTHSTIKTRRITVNELCREHRNGDPVNHLENEVYIGESIEDVFTRGRRFLELVQSIESDNVGVIAHSMFIWCFLQVCGQPAKVLRNCEAVTFEI